MQWEKDQNFSFRRVSSDFLCVSIKYPHQEVIGEISLFYAVVILAFGITSLTHRHLINGKKLPLFYQCKQHY